MCAHEDLKESSQLISLEDVLAKICQRGRLLRFCMLATFWQNIKLPDVRPDVAACSCIIQLGQKRAFISSQSFEDLVEELS
jgi:hypothetical protein